MQIEKTAIYKEAYNRVLSVVVAGTAQIGVVEQGGRTAVLGGVVVLAGEERGDALGKRLILATGRYRGEGLDDSKLDTLFLAMPFNWKGTLA
jgi:hypothetical protein